MTGQSETGARSTVTAGAHPAIILIPKGTEPDGSYPQPDAVTGVVTGALETAGWSNPTDILLDVRVECVPYQDEVPPTPPVEKAGVVVAFGQCPVTAPHGYDGPFQIALDALAGEYGDRMELAVDAVSTGSDPA